MSGLLLRQRVHRVPSEKKMEARGVRASNYAQKKTETKRGAQDRVGHVMPKLCEHLCCEGF
jgi:hypothetical protein